MFRVTGATVLVGIAIMIGSCQSAGAGGDNPKQDKPAAKTAFAADREMEYFDAKRAMSYLDDICKIGTRISGSRGMERQQALLCRHFEGLGAHVEKQVFKAQQRSQNQPVEMTNLIVSWHPERTQRVIICSHYDTRPAAHEEPKARWHLPFLSANDGGSGVALLMELGHVVKDIKTSVGVDFVFFDGEEYIFNPAQGGDKYFFGSEHFAAEYKKNHAKRKYQAAVLLDMIAGKNPKFPVERNSLFFAKPLMTDLWRIAAEQRCDAFVNREGPDVLDDHLALNRAGIPAVDIIDFNYPHWHKLSDVPENCSSEGMDQVARVLIAWLKRV